jgi:hypothetical protein
MNQRQIVRRNVATRLTNPGSNHFAKNPKAAMIAAVMTPAMTFREILSCSAIAGFFN